MISLNHLVQPKEVITATLDVLESGRYVKGQKCEAFEEAWAKRCCKKYAIGVSSGATALELAIQAVFADHDEDYITTQDYTFKAVWNAIRRNGFGEAFDNQRPDIYAHHLHDEQPKYIPLLEDCSHAHGYIPVAETAIFSLYPAKILGACGDAGIIVTDNEKVAEECKRLRNHGDNGTNARMDEIQAAVLLAKLPYLDSWIARRKEIVDQYDKALGRNTPGGYHYAYCIPGSEEKKQKLIDAGIESAFYYTEEYMALPLHPFLTQEEIDKIICATLEL